MAPMPLAVACAPRIATLRAVLAVPVARRLRAGSTHGHPAASDRVHGPRATPRPDDRPPPAP